MQFQVYSTETLRLEPLASPTSLNCLNHLSKLIVNYCIKDKALYVNDLYILWALINSLSWTTKKHQKTLSRPLHFKLKKIQGLFKDFHRKLRTFQDCVNPETCCPKWDLPGKNFTFILLRLQCWHSAKDAKYCNSLVRASHKLWIIAWIIVCTCI